MDEQPELTDDELDDLLQQSYADVVEVVTSSPKWQARKAAILRRAAGVDGYN